jgi:hypothetical protein
MRSHTNTHNTNLRRESLEEGKALLEMQAVTPDNELIERKRELQRQLAELEVKMQGSRSD